MDNKHNMTEPDIDIKKWISIADTVLEQYEEKNKSDEKKCLIF